MNDVIGALILAAAAGGCTWGTLAMGRFLATGSFRRERPSKMIIGVDLAKPGSDCTSIAKFNGHEITQIWHDEAAAIPPGMYSHTQAKMLAEMNAQMESMMAKAIDPSVIATAGKPMTAAEVLARRQQFDAMINSRHGSKSNLAGLLAQSHGVNGMIGGLGMPGMGPSMGAPLPPGLADPSDGVGSSPPPKEAPTAVIPNLLAGMNKDEVGAFIERVKAQRVSAPDDKRANYDAMIEAAEKRLAEISTVNAATMQMVMNAMDALAKSGSTSLSGLLDPVAAAGIIGDIMKGIA